MMKERKFVLSNAKRSKKRRKRDVPGMKRNTKRQIMQKNGSDQHLNQVNHAAKALVHKC
jgi:hypothetical protein